MELMSLIAQTCNVVKPTKVAVKVDGGRDSCAELSLSVMIF